MQSIGLRLRSVLQPAFELHHLPCTARAFRILPDPKRPGVSDPGASDEKGTGEDVMRREAEALGQTGQKEKGEDQSFGLSDDDQKAARERGYDKPQMSRGQSESGGRTSDLRKGVSRSTEEADKEGSGSEASMRELRPEGPGEKPEHKEA